MSTVESEACSGPEEKQMKGKQFAQEWRIDNSRRIEEGKQYGDINKLLTTLAKWLLTLT